MVCMPKRPNFPWDYFRCMVVCILTIKITGSLHQRSWLQVLSEMAVSGGVVGSPDTLIRVYQQLFCLQAYPHTNIVKYNDFSDFSTYLVQKVHHACATFFINPWHLAQQVSKCYSSVFKFASLRSLICLQLFCTYPYIVAFLLIRIHCLCFDEKWSWFVFVVAAQLCCQYQERPPAVPTWGALLSSRPFQIQW